MHLLTVEKQINPKKDVNAFLQLLKQFKIEEAVTSYVHDEFDINFNGKLKRLKNQTWFRYLKKKILNNKTHISQFHLRNINVENDNINYDIFMICHKPNGELFFTEVNVNNLWINNTIAKINYKTRNY